MGSQVYIFPGLHQLLACIPHILQSITKRPEEKRKKENLAINNTMHQKSTTRGQQEMMTGVVGHGGDHCTITRWISQDLWFQ